MLGRRGTTIAVSGAVAVLPLVVAVVALLWRPWAPVLDLAMTEFRVRDVGGRFTPRIGLPGRIGDFPDQGSHPGPWSFYLVAPFYRLGAATAWGMQLGSVVVNSAAFVGVVVIGHRLAGRRGAIALAAVAAVAIRGFGLDVLTHPWNPYFPLALFLLLLVAAWAVLAGDHAMAVVVAFCASVAAQTHVPYLLSCVAVSVLVLGVLIARWRRSDGIERHAVARSTLLALGVTAVLWVPPLVDQWRRDPGNLTMLYRHFTGEPTEPLVSIGTAIRVFLRHLDAFGALGRLLTDPNAFVVRSGTPTGSGITGSLVGGSVVLALWVAGAWYASRRGHRLLVALNSVVGVALLAGLVSMARIFGKVWFYLTLWAWMTLLLVLLSILWTALLLARDRRRELVPADAPVRLATVVGIVATLLSLTAVVTHDVPEPNLSDGLRAVVPPTVDALERGAGEAVGPDGTYLVFWQDAVFIGAQGYGLVNELERRGFDVGVHTTWRVPVTHHRVLAPGSYDAEIHLVSGDYIDDWRSRPDHVEVATVDVRTDDERRRFDELEAQVDDRLRELGRPELIDVVDGNLFGASLDPDLPQDVIDDMAEMLLIGEPVSVFIAPAGSTF
ncbi:MAG: hypothetical protein HKN41_07350 [Ilumatobacter sp.]|nr:hypothetical protein [Ilumatobacter sp.]